MILLLILVIFSSYSNKLSCSSFLSLFIIFKGRHWHISYFKKPSRTTFPRWQYINIFINSQNKYKIKKILDQLVTIVIWLYYLRSMVSIRSVNELCHIFSYVGSIRRTKMGKWTKKALQNIQSSLFIVCHDEISATFIFLQR